MDDELRRADAGLGGLERYGRRSGCVRFRAGLPSSGDAITFQAEETYPNLPRTGLFPLRVALTSAGAPGESSSSALVIGLVVAAGVVFAVLGWLLVGRRRPSQA